MSDIFGALRRDHERIRAALETVKQARAMRGERLAEATRLLEAHDLFEREVFYPALELAGDVESEIDDALTDHDDVMSLLLELGDRGVDDPECDLLLTECLVAFDRHVDLEERRLFDIARTDLHASSLETLAAKHEIVRAQMDRT